MTSRGPGGPGGPERGAEPRAAARRTAGGWAARPRIGVITTSYPRWPGDPAGSFAAGHAAWLARRGWVVDVICAGDGATGPAEPGRARGGVHGWTDSDIDGVRVLRAPAPAALFYAGGAPEALEAGAVSALSAAAFSAGLAARVAWAARRWSAAVAHWLIPSAVAAALIPRRLPILAIAHSGDVHTLARVGGATAVAALLAARGVRLAFVSSAVREAFAGAIRSRRLVDHVRSPRVSIVCPMGIDAARFRALRRPRPGDSGDGSDGSDGDGPPAVLFLGRLVPVKGADVLLAAAARVTRPMRVIIAGDGPERPRLEALARDLTRDTAHSVQFLGEVHGRDRDRAIARADVAVLPSIALPGGRTEGMPVTALELMAAGVPVIASRIGGLAELPEAAAVRVVPGDPAALAAALAATLADSAGLRAQIAAAAAVADEHDWSAIGPRLDAHWIPPGGA